MPNEHCWGPPNCDKACYPTESPANNFIGLRVQRAETNILFAKYQSGNQTAETVEFDKPDFHELFDARSDPWMMRNIFKTTPNATLTALDTELHAWFKCAADSCP